MMQEEAVEVISEGVRLDVRIANATVAGRYIVMVHGGPGGDLRGPGGLFDVLCPQLWAAGHGTIRFSLRGSGDSAAGNAPGSRRTATVSEGATDSAAVIDFLRSITDKAPIIIAESMGATVALLRSTYVASVAGWVLLWPALNLHDTDLRGFLTPRSMAQARNDGHLTIDALCLGVEFLEECLAVDVGSALRDIEAPTLVLQGDADAEVPVSHRLRAAAILGEMARLVIVPGGDHGLKRPQEREAVLSAIHDHLSTLTS